MDIKLNHIFCSFVFFVLVDALPAKAQTFTSDDDLLIEKYDETFIHNALHLYNQQEIENKLAIRLNIDANECHTFLKYAHRNNLLSYSDYFSKVKTGEINTEEEALTYWTSMLPTFEKVYKKHPRKISNSNSVATDREVFAGSCNNLDFGTGKTTGWQAAWCTSASIKNYNLLAANLPTKGFNSSATGNQNGYVHEMMTAATDPYAPISTVPPGHTYSLRLGEDRALDDSHQMVSNTFTVDPANPTITYWYAVVFEKGTGHTGDQQPYFKIKMFDDKGASIGCAVYDVDATIGSNGGFEEIKSKGKNIVYKDWTPIYIPLINYVGKQVTIQFESSDCSLSAHFGYAYLAVDCNPFKMITTSPYICGNNNITLTAPDGASTYLWSGPGAIAPLDKKSININAPGKYSVKMTVVGNSGITCEFILDTLIAGNASLPVALFSNTSVCAGQPVTFTDLSTPTGSITSWSWDFNNDGVEDSNLQNPTYTFTSNGTFPVKLKIKQGPCDATITQNVVVESGSSLVITNPIPDCIQPSVNLTAPAITAGSTGALNLSYWMDLAATQPLTNPTAITVSGIYYIKSGTGSCSETKPVMISLNGKPVSNAGLDVTFCTGGSVAIGTTALPNLSYIWTLASGGAATGLSSNIVANPTVSLSNTGTLPSTTVYIVQTINTLTGCNSHDTINVIVNVIPTANAGTSQSLCIGTPIKLNGGIGGSASIGTWSGGAGTFNPSNTNLQAVYTPSQAEYDAGSVKLTLTTDDPVGDCTFASSDVQLNFYKNPAINFVVDKPKGCPVHCVKFTDSTIVTPDNIASWQWDFGDGSAKSSTQNPAHCYNKPGYYDVTLTAVSSHGCSNTLTKPKTIQVFTIPVAAFTIHPNPILVTNPLVTLTNQSSADVVYWHYSFGDGDTFGNITPSPVHLYPKEKPATYQASLIVKNAGGCTATVSHELKVLPEFTFFIPNAFTPDKDGNNDIFYGKGVGIEKYNFWIFNRWGDLIYHTEDLSEGWNGRVKGGEEIAQQDVYVWKVKLTDALNKEHNYIGTVTLVK